MFGSSVNHIPLRQDASKHIIVVLRNTTITFGGCMKEKGDAKGPFYSKGRHSKSYHWWLKRWKARFERRKGKKCFDCKPTYNRYKGYEL